MDRSRGPVVVVSVLAGLVVVAAFVVLVVALNTGDAGSPDADEALAGPQVPTVVPDDAPSAEPSPTVDPDPTPRPLGAAGDRITGPGYSIVVPEGWHELDDDDDRSIILAEDPEADPLTVDNQISIYRFDAESIQTSAGFEPSGVCQRETQVLSNFVGGEPEVWPQREVAGDEAPGRRLDAEEHVYLLRCIRRGELVYNPTSKASPQEATRVEEVYGELLDSWEWT